MTDKEKDTGVKQDADDQDKEDQTQDSDAADQGDKNDKDDGEKKVIEVTPDVLRAMRDEIKGLKDQNALYKAQSQAQQQVSMNPPQTPNPALQAQGVQGNAKVEGGEISFDMDDDDVITGKDLKKILKAVNQQGATQPHVDVELAKRLAMIELGQQDPNWQETIQKFLPDMINSNPAIVQMIHSSENPLQSALTFARMNPKYTQAQKDGNDGNSGGGGNDDIVSQIDKIIKNAEKPGSGAGTGGKTGIDTSDKYTNMSDEEFDEHVEKVLQGTN